MIQFFAMTHECSTNIFAQAGTSWLVAELRWPLTCLSSPVLHFPPGVKIVDKYNTSNNFNHIGTQRLEFRVFCLAIWSVWLWVSSLLLQLLIPVVQSCINLADMLLFVDCFHVMSGHQICRRLLCQQLSNCSNSSHNSRVIWLRHVPFGYPLLWVEATSVCGYVRNRAYSSLSEHRHRLF